eukprot:CAMPEP_0206241612 /NCGR_PEP_ID=MMETSP0047_2-20121206/16587_1 /ASSEMBLY_ACC=CAM_ASM_000192 /TAXON_ID=195065 /ORGANISM="Chroomonas mesostigmatica_cf, Strain CCMP1168" /LENGTH=292 /DNA_ID=CAMNT_0053666517 /DNA_START=86 /DNA_END=964 /DNA_ORIENTATION=+
MDWLRKAAADVESQFAKTGLAEQLAPVTKQVSQTAGEGASLFKSFSTQIESHFNAETGEKSGDKNAVSLDKVGPPWVTSHMGLKAFEADMRASILKITEGEEEVVHSRLKEVPPDEEYEFDWLEPNNTARAMAALDADERLTLARKKLVPSKIVENKFWRNYFYKCDMIVNSYLKMTKDKKEQTKAVGGEGGARYPDASDNIDNDFENIEFVSDDTTHQAIENEDLKTQAKAELGLSWEEEMAKELGGIDDDDEAEVVDAADTSTTSAAGGGEEEEDEDEMDAYAKELGDIK